MKEDKTYRDTERPGQPSNQAPGGILICKCRNGRNEYKLFISYPALNNSC